MQNQSEEYYCAGGSKVPISGDKMPDLDLWDCVGYGTPPVQFSQQRVYNFRFLIQWPRVGWMRKAFRESLPLP